MPITLGELAPLEGVKRWAFAEKARRIRIASAIPGGAIHVSSAWFVVVGDAVYVPLDPTVGDPGQTTTPDHRHIEIIDAGGAVSALIDEGDEVSNFRAVQLEGSAEAVHDVDLIDELSDVIAEKYFYVGHPDLEYYFSAGNLAARRWYRIVADRVDGWDMRELPQAPVQDLLSFPDHVLHES
ncbi:hypothetical protein VX037_23595 [Gordonia sp. Z-3]|uniref:hypothetical protein n=1 Tax=Gordonia sp. Z-3 TaxID=3115408 RepID=UPI002E2BBE6C|nr:hypothetical protein [Gordonia sp. Z-3]MED5804011.1 hypothetical protein [Gordonia sp. Z-3]